MDPSSLPIPPAEWLEHLHKAAQWERLIELAKQRLGTDPSDPAAHYHLAWAYARTDRSQEMWPHVSHLLQIDPENQQAHHLAAIYFLEMKQLKGARLHLDFLLRSDSQNGVYHYLACILALRSNQPPLARHHIRETRRLLPEWAPGAHLEIMMASDRSSATRLAWDTLDRLEKALALEPDNIEIQTSIGDVYLNDLEMPDQAEASYRSALARNPANKKLQGKLLTALRHRNLLLRTLSLPHRIVIHLGNQLSTATMSWRLLTLIFLIKFIVLFLTWLVSTWVLFTPVAKVYEWLVVSDIHLSSSSGFSRPFSALRGTPMWMRTGLLLTGMIGLWTVIFHYLLGISWSWSCMVAGAILTIHLAAVASYRHSRRLRSRWGKVQATRMKRKAAPPPLAVHSRD